MIPRKQLTNTLQLYALLCVTPDKCVTCQSRKHPVVWYTFEAGLSTVFSRITAKIMREIRLPQLHNRFLFPTYIILTRQNSKYKDGPREYTYSKWKARKFPNIVFCARTLHVYSGKKTSFLSSPSLYRFSALEIARNPENVLTSTTWQH